jgi:tyrosyl-tRNA synthetase
MQTGRTLMKNWRNKESFIIATEFLSGTDGRKMSKSWKNAIWLDDSAEDMYAKVLAVNDDLIIQYYTLGTNVSMEEVNEAKKALENGEHPMRIKKELAFEIIEELHGLDQAEKARQSFEKIVQGKEIPDELIEITIKDTVSLLDVLIINNLSSSKSEAKRLIEQGGVTMNDEKITDPNERIKEGILKVGKRKFVKVTVKE